MSKILVIICDVKSKLSEVVSIIYEGWGKSKRVNLEAFYKIDNQTIIII
ncbi:MAG: hypothetical protein ACI936_004236 [Paraglaciecola sp.]|jgi:hypothetical protein